MKESGVNRMILLIFGITLLLSIAILLIFYIEKDSINLRKQLNLGNKYLTEMDYEQAIASFLVVLEAYPQNVDAYLGISEAYLGIEDLESALTILHKGYNQVQDIRLKNRIDEVLKMQQEKMELLNETEKEKCVELSFAPSDISLFGYDLMENHFKDVCDTIDMSDKGYLDYGNMLVVQVQDETNLNFVEHDNKWFMAYIIDDNSSNISLIITDWSSGHEYTNPECFYCPILLGDSYDKCKKVFQTEKFKLRGTEYNDYIDIKGSKYKRINYSLMSQYGEAHYSEYDVPENFTEWYPISCRAMCLDIDMEEGHFHVTIYLDDSDKVVSVQWTFQNN